MQGRIILVIGLCRIEAFERNDLRYDWAGKYLRLIELRDVGLRDSLLFIIRIKDRRSVLRTFIGALTVQLRGIVRNREEYAQQFSVGDLRRIVDDLNRLGMAGVAGAHKLIFGSLSLSAGVAGGRGNHSPDVLEYSLHAPEASSGKHSRLLTRAGRIWSIERWRRYRRYGRICFCVAGCDTQECQKNNGQVSRRLHEALRVQYETMKLLDWTRLMGEKLHSLWRTKALRPGTPGPPDSRGGCPYMVLAQFKDLATGELTAALGSGRGIRW